MKGVIYLIVQLCIVARGAAFTSYREQYCEAAVGIDLSGVTLSDDPCHTCRGQCGTVQQLTRAAEFNFKTCSCDPQCLAYGDCCRDFEAECPTQHLAALDIQGRYQFTSRGMGAVCTTLREQFSFPLSLIASCRHDDNACTVHPFTPKNGDYDGNNVITKDEVFYEVPVLDLDTGLEFVNSRCAKCNGVQNGRPWGVSMYCGSSLNNTESPFTNATTDDVLLAINQNHCSHVVQLPMERKQTMRICNTRVTRTCSEHCNNSDVVDACLSRGSNIVFDQRLDHYANEFCALCNSEMDPEIDPGFMCGYEIRDVGAFFPTAPNYVILFQFNQDLEEGIDLPADYKPCPPGHKFLNYESGCQPVFCQEGFILVGESCMYILCPEGHVLVGRFCTRQFPNVELLRFTTGFDLTPLTDSEAVSLVLAQFTSECCTEITQMSNGSFRHVVEMSCRGRVDTDNISVLTTLTIIIKTPNSLDDPDIDGPIRHGAVSRAVSQRLGIFDRLLDSNTIANLTFNGFRRSHDSNSNVSTACVYFVFNVSDYVLYSNGSVTITTLNVTIDTSDYVIEHTLLYVCHKVFENDSVKQTRHVTEGALSTGEVVLRLLSFVCLCLSGLCLFIRVVLQPCVPLYHTLPMKLQFNFCLALFVSVALILISSVLKDVKTWCDVTAIALHYFFLASFSWMTVISIDMFKIFSNFSNIQASTNRKEWKSLLFYSLAAWCFPIPIVTTAIVVEHQDAISDTLKPRYGVERCWVSSQGFGTLIFFAGPVFLLTILNITVFLVVAFNLRRKFKQRDEIAMERKLHYCTYFKLYVIMGVGYLLILLTPFIDHIALHICVIVANGMHGVYVAMAFVFTRPVGEQLGVFCRTGKVMRIESKVQGVTKSTNTTSSPKHIHHDHKSITDSPQLSNI